MPSLIRVFPSRLNVIGVLSYWLNIIWSCLAQKEAAQARPRLHLSKCHIVGNHILQLICLFLNEKCVASKWDVKILSHSRIGILLNQPTKVWKWLGKMKNVRLKLTGHPRVPKNSSSDPKDFLAFWKKSNRIQTLRNDEDVISSLVNPYSAKKKMHLKMSSAANNCLTLLTN